MTLHLSLPEDLEIQIKHKVESGMYDSEGDVVREALRLYFNQCGDFGQLSEGEILDTVVLPRIEALKNGTLETSPWSSEEMRRWRKEEADRIASEQNLL